METNYQINLTDNQWQVIEKIINPQIRKRKHSLRSIMEAIFYLNRTGCQWRMLPSNFAPWQTVYFYFSKWKNEGVIEQIMEELREMIRKSVKKEVSPNIGIIDSRSVKTSHHTDPSCKGIDGNKKIKGRKEHIVVDTLGLPLSIVVHDASTHDSKGASSVLEKMKHKFPRMKKILADGGYRGSLSEWVKKNFGWDLEVVLRPEESRNKFKVLPIRWIDERTFSWLENYRRLTIDYEYLAETSEAMIQIAFIQIMLNKFPQ